MKALTVFEQIQEKTGILREYRETDAMVHVRGLLDLLERSYKDDLADVAAADLTRVQGALKQVMNMREAIFGREGMIPRL